MLLGKGTVTSITAFPIVTLLWPFYLVFQMLLALDPLTSVS